MRDRRGGKDVGSCTSNISWDVRPLWLLISSDAAAPVRNKKSAGVARYMSRAGPISSGLIPRASPTSLCRPCRTVADTKSTSTDTWVKGWIRCEFPGSSDPGWQLVLLLVGTGTLDIFLFFFARAGRCTRSLERIRSGREVELMVPCKAGGTADCGWRTSGWTGRLVECLEVSEILNQVCCVCG